MTSLITSLQRFVSGLCCRGTRCCESKTSQIMRAKQESQHPQPPSRIQYRIVSAEEHDQTVVNILNERWKSYSPDFNSRERQDKAEKE